MDWRIKLENAFRIAFIKIVLVWGGPIKMGKREHDNNNLQGASCSTQKRGKKMTENKMIFSDLHMWFIDRNLERLSTLITSVIG